MKTIVFSLLVNYLLVIGVAFSAQPNELFEATMGDKTYKVAISCSDFDKDYFRFYSDKNDVTDSNKDGFIISGFQDGNKLTLTIVDNGVTYSAPGINFEKNNDGGSGQGNLWEDGGKPLGIKTTYTVSCS